MSLQIINASSHLSKPVPTEPFLNVSEFFCDTIQGEGVNTGYPAAFLRFQGCTQNCRWCFGVKPGRRVPKITTYKGPNKKINEVQKGEILLTFDSTSKKLVETAVTEILSRQVTLWHEIQTEHFLYYVTPEHPFFMTDGTLKEASALKPGDEVFHSSGVQKISYIKKKDNPMFNSETVRKSKENTDWKALGEKNKATIKRKKEDGTYKAGIDIYKEKNPEGYKVLCKRMSENKKGDKNPNYKKETYCPNLKALKESLSGNLRDCAVCGTSSKLEVHHWDGNDKNDDPPNLVAICHKCHSNLHNRGYNFWNGKRKDNKVSSTKAEEAQNGIKILSNKVIDLTQHPHYGRSYGPKSLTVFNLTCSPHNSYLVDNMWVHNCDSKEVWKNGSPYSINEILTRMDMFDLPTKLFNGQHLVFTGGSPLKQQKGLLQFILAFSAAYGFIPFIEIENECIIDPLVDLIPYINVWNNSPKLSNSGNPDHIRYQPELIKRMARLQNSYFKFVIAQKEDWEEIERDFLKPNLIKKSQIILMPLGDTKKAVLKSGPLVAEMAIENNVRFINREHVILWDKRTGV